jgi:2-polyprenyl-3-methyl-5-hydroxy-6-metoxy-1,4-benzoquinol methylase
VSDSKENEKVWSHFSLANELSPAQRHRWRLVLGALRGLPPEAVIIDLGCGSGVLLEKISRAYPAARLRGIDVEPRALAIARERLPSAELLALDLDSENLAPPSWQGVADVVVCSEVLEHLSEPRHALALARDLLKPGGRLVVTVPSGAMNDFDRSIGHRKHYEVGELASLLTAAGFAGTNAQGWGFPFHTLFRIVLSIAPQTTDQFTDERIGVVHRALFRFLDALFYLNIHSSSLGRQLIGTAARPH